MSRLQKVFLVLACVFFAATIYSLFFLKILFIIIFLVLHSICLYVFCYLCFTDQMDKAVTVSKVSFGDYTFGKNDAKKAGVEMPDFDDGEEHKVPAGNREISNAATAQIVVTLYSVYEMDKPNVD